MPKVTNSWFGEGRLHLSLHGLLPASHQNIWLVRVSLSDMTDESQRASIKRAAGHVSDAFVCLCRVRYAPRWDCGSEYRMTVQLLDHKKKVLREFAPETVYFPQWNDQQWHQVCTKPQVQWSFRVKRTTDWLIDFCSLINYFQLIHVFKNYGPGVRYIKFTHGGKDTQFWAGWYGIRVTDSCVEICPALDTDNWSDFG